MIPVAPGVTPGSGPGHLGLFGYDPIEYQVGRGVIEALGLGVELKAGDIAARANFCTLDAKGIVTDRRAGRIATEVTEELCALLSRKVKKAATPRSSSSRAKATVSWSSFAARDWKGR
jgi:2,3-bisphosphoglycerate-independent phosphoglycerate mutase